MLLNCQYIKPYTVNHTLWQNINFTIIIFCNIYFNFNYIMTWCNAFQAPATENLPSQTNVDYLLPHETLWRYDHHHHHEVLKPNDKIYAEEH